MHLLRVSLMVVVCGVIVGVAGQPTGCVTNDQCPVDHFCASTGYCRECLRCEDLKRQPPSTPTSCIMSVVKCGDCFPGLVEDPSGDVSASCVPPGDGGGGGGGAPAYLWAAVAAGLLLLVLIAALVVYMLRNTDTLKILASTRASVQSPSNGMNGSGTGATRVPADYRVPPPPYNALAPHYQPVRPTSPPAPPADELAPTPPVTVTEEPCEPFIKRARSRRERAAREHDAAQEARVYNTPHYVRGPHLPPSYESATSGDESGPELHDENTMESTWSPAPLAPPAAAPPAPAAPATRDANRSSVGGATSELAALAAAAASDEQPTPSKMLCLRQDANNNSNSSRGGEGASSSGPAPAPPAPPAPALTFNITVQQHNDLKLIRT